MEFKIVKLESGVAVFNFEELRDKLIAKLEGYKGYLVTEENIATSKKDKANLNNLAKAIEDKRKEVKKAIMREYDEVFEPQCKELVGYIKNVSDEINVQVKALEEKEKNEKLEIVKLLWESLNFELIDLDEILQLSWLNKGMTEKKILNHMEDIIVGIQDDLVVLENMENSDELKAKYLTNLNLKATLTNYRAEMEARERLGVKPEVVEVVEVVGEQEAGEEKKTVTIEIKASLSKMRKLRNLLESNGYEFRQLTDIQ